MSNFKSETGKGSSNKYKLNLPGSTMWSNFNLSETSSVANKPHKPFHHTSYSEMFNRNTDITPRYKKSLHLPSSDSKLYFSSNKLAQTERILNLTKVSEFKLTLPTQTKTIKTPQTNLRSEQQQRRRLYCSTQYSRKLSQGSEQFLLHQHRRRKQITAQDGTANLFIQTQELKSQYCKSFKNSDVEQAISSLSEMLIRLAYVNNVVGFLQVYRLVGDTYFQQDQKNNAINVYMQISQLCDWLNEIPKVSSEIKPQVLLYLAEIAQELSLLEEAKRLLHRALQYAWYFEDVDLELRIYERLGLISYLSADLQKATYYHNRSQQGKFEPKDSSSHIMADNNLKWYLSKLPKGIDGIDGQLTSKAIFLPFFYNTYSNNIPEPPIKVTNQFILTHNVALLPQKHRFSTLVGYHQLYEQLMSTEEFIYEVGNHEVATMTLMRASLKDPIKISHLSPNRDLNRYGMSHVTIANPQVMFRKTLE